MHLSTICDERISIPGYKYSLHFEWLGQAGSVAPRIWGNIFRLGLYRSRIKQGF